MGRMAAKKPDDLVTKTKAAKIVGLSRQAIDQAIKRGSLGVHTVMEPVEYVSRAEVLVYAKLGKRGRKK